uniref:Arginine decarboxylase n=1 Tax=Solanum tuberosum TaxID=4113 RepID=M1BZW2_SOLTU
MAAPSSLIDVIGIGPFLHDATELPELDRFGYPTGPLLDAQQMAANLFGASQTWFLVCGTTCGILAAIMSTCSPGDTLILARNSHVSATSAMVKMAIEELEQEGKKAAGVFITSPTYNGVCSNISEISQICHSHGIPLIVDEAHGAHFKFHPDMPKTALSQGADLVIQSTHKVLCSFSQSSMLHLSGDRIDRDRVHKCLQSLQTTSPNWLLLASLDATRDELSKNPNTLFNEVMELVIQVKELINHIPGVSLLDLSCFSNNFSFMDPLRMTIGVQELGLSGFDVYNILSTSHGIEPELIGTQSFTLAFSLGTTKEHAQRLVSGLKYLSINFLQEEREIIKIDHGIPVLIPGEIITKRAMDYLIQVKDQGAFLKGAVDPLLSTVVVCDF